MYEVRYLADAAGIFTRRGGEPWNLFFQLLILPNGVNVRKCRVT